MSQARRKISYIEEAVNIIQNIGYDNLTPTEQRRTQTLITKLVQGIESAQELSAELEKQ